MIIQCEQCQAKFKLDDSKVTDKGVKVRCAKCKHVFSVTREKPPTEQQDFAPPSEQTDISRQEEAFSPEPTPQEPPGPFSFASESPEEPVFSAPAPQPTEPEEQSVQFSFDPEPPEEDADSTVRMEAGAIESNVPDSSFTSSVNDEFSLSSLEDESGFAVERDEVSSSDGDVDFDSFDFGGGEDADKTMVAPPPSADFGDKTMIQQFTAPVAAIKEEPQGLDFSDDDMFGAVITPPVEEPSESISFDFGTDSFADSMDMGTAESGQKGGTSLSLESAAEAPFSLGEIDFGDELTSVAVQQVNPEELKPSQEILFAPLAEAQEKIEPTADDDLKRAFSVEAAQTQQDDLPPLSIASRRKQSPIATALIAVVSLLVVGVLGYIGFTAFSDDKGTAAKEAGKISVRAVKAAYVKNASAGSMLVISGEAVNEYAVPQAALQVKGVIFDAKGQILASKSAFGGNLLTDEQLTSMPLDKIEAAMANQFGDSLSNLEVAPGKVVPFMIVISSPPKEGKDFGVEPTGSTVASGKTQK